MIISNKQIMHLLSQLKDHRDMLIRISYSNVDYVDYLTELYNEITDQQSNELRSIE